MINKKNLFTARGREAAKNAFAPREEDYQPNYVVELHLRDILRKRNMKQKELAELTGLRPNVISNLCRGTVERLYLDHIGKIATALEITDIRELMVLVEEEDAEWNSLHYVQDIEDFEKEQEEDADNN
jgi:transcriptional regulator with XRE-family HTH domain